jgi:hypothetical protein
MTDRVEWRFDFDIMNDFEISTQLARHVLPARVQPFEVRPGISLISFSLHKFAKGNLQGRLPEFTEASCAIMIQPFLARHEFPLPRFSLYVLSVVSSCSEFLSHAAEVDKMPTYYSPDLRCNITESGRRVEVEDGSGKLFTLENRVLDPSFTAGKINGQAVTSIGGKLHRMAFAWEGLLFEHQKRTDGGDFFAHPALGGLEVPAGRKECHHQMLTPQNAPGRVIYERRPDIY